MNCARPLPVQSLRPCIPSIRSAFARGLRTRGANAQATTTTSTSTTNGDPTGEPRRMHRIESMPFQTYQLALEVIRKDQLEKLEAINVERKRIANMNKKPIKTPGDERRIKSMVRYLEYLRIQADINSPRVKYNFDRGIIGMNKPVYRFLLDRKWREYRRPILMQRLTQMHVVPDVLPAIDPVVDVQIRFRGRDIQPGAFVNSLHSETPPTFKVIPFTEGQMLCTVAVVDSDVPNIEEDSFSYRLHWMVTNIPISPSKTQAIGTGAGPSDTIFEWMPPHVQKGSPYHRYSMIVFKQPGKIDAEALKNKKMLRDGFIMRSFQDKNQLKPIGAFMFRGQWDEHTKEVMQRNNMEGWDKMFVQKN